MTHSALKVKHRLRIKVRETVVTTVSLMASSRVKCIACIRMGAYQVIRTVSRRLLDRRSGRRL